MPKRSKTPYGYETPGFRDYPIDGYFSDNDLESLFEKSNIPSEKWKEAGDHLNNAAHIYFVYKNGWDGGPTNREIDADLRGIKSVAEALLGRLEDLDNVSNLKLWAPLTGTRNLAFASDRLDIKEELTPLGVKIEREPDGNDGHFISYGLPHDFIQAVSVIKNCAAQAIEESHPGKRGPKTIRALDIWAANVRTLFENILQREFTFSENKGEPTSEAAFFSLRALQTIGEEVSPQRHHTAMRREIVKKNRSQ